MDGDATGAQVAAVLDVGGVRAHLREVTVHTAAATDRVTP